MITAEETRKRQKEAAKRKEQAYQDWRERVMPAQLAALLDDTEAKITAKLESTERNVLVDIVDKTTEYPDQLLDEYLAIVSQPPNSYQTEVYKRDGYRIKVAW